MNDLSDKFLNNGSVVYAAKVDSVTTHAGNKRIEIEILINTQRIDIVQIFWNNNENRVDVPAGNRPGLYRQIIDNMEEGSYLFNLVSIDKYGNESLPVEVSGTVYGDDYLSRLRNRPVSATVKAGDLVTVRWGSADITNGAQYTEVVYTCSDGSEKTVQTPASEQATGIPDYMPGTHFKYRTVYLPDLLALDPVATEYQEVNDYFSLDKNTWTILDYSSQVNTAAENVVQNAINGSYTDRWHSADSAYPHFITLDLGNTATIIRFAVCPSTYDLAAGVAIDSRFPTRVRFEVSLDNEEWTDLGEYDCDNGNTPGARYFDVTPVPARYYRFTGLQTTSGNYMVIGELDIYCK
jgi:hypothetical protein